MDIKDEEYKNKLFEAIISIDNIDDCKDFFEDICTIKEIHDMAQRLQVARLLRNKKVFSDIIKETRASSATISRVNKCLNYGTGGYNKILEEKEKN